ncbi:hypothetical protein ACS0TY_003514 [Phlomoides rotata]
MEVNVEKRREEILKLDLIDDTLGLEDWEIYKRNEEQAWLLVELEKRDSLLRQKSRVKWLEEGDNNSRFFHNFINKRRKRNEILGMLIEDEWREEVVEQTLWKGTCGETYSDFRFCDQACV